MNKNQREIRKKIKKVTALALERQKIISKTPAYVTGHWQPGDIILYDGRWDDSFAGGRRGFHCLGVVTSVTQEESYRIVKNIKTIVIDEFIYVLWAGNASEPFKKYRTSSLNKLVVMRPRGNRVLPDDKKDKKTRATRR